MPVLHRLLIGFFAVAALMFSLAPIFEGPDEIEHYRYAQYLADNHAFPPQTGQMRGQFHHTPLYYLLVSPVLWAIDDTDFQQIETTVNPYSGFSFGIPGTDNKTSYVPTHATRSFPYTSPTSRAVHLMRLLNVALGTGTVIVAYGVFRLLWPGLVARQTLALAVLVGWQQFAYLSGMITNDVLVTFAATASLYLLLWVQRQAEPSWRWAVGFGAVLAAALLAKANGLVLGFYVVVVLLMNRKLWRYVPLIGGVVLVGAGWWYIRNLIVIGDLTGIGAMYQTWPGERVDNGTWFPWQVGLERVPFVYRSVWARFGSGAIGLPQWAYRPFDLLVIVGGAGLLWRLGRWLRHRQSDPVQIRLNVTLLAYTLIWLPMIFYYTSTVYSGNQGRFALVAVVGWAALIAWGVSAWVPHRIMPWVAQAVALVMVWLMGFSLIGYYFPAFHPTPSRAEGPPLYTYADAAELLDAEISTDGTAPHTHFYVTLHWRALGPTDIDLLTYVHGVEGDWLRRDSYPGTGTLRSTDWQPGQTWAERFVVPVPGGALVDQQRVYRVIAGLYDPTTETPLPATPPTADDATLPLIGDVAVHGDPQPTLNVAYRIGDSVTAAAPTLPDDETLCLTWQLAQPAPADYSVYVHLLAADGELIAQQDHQPLAGGYPFTRWTSAEVVDYCLSLPAALPPDGQIRIGLYDPTTGERPPITTADDQRVPFIALPGSSGGSSANRANIGR
jgi:hypothetical protein